MGFSQRGQLTKQTWRIRRRVGVGIALAQAAAVVTVHAIDRMRVQRIPGGVHGFPALEPADTRIGGTSARTSTDGTSLYNAMLEAIDRAHHHLFLDTLLSRSD